MKNLYLVAILALAGLGGTARPAAAWICKPCGHCCHRCRMKCCATIYCERYNAFSACCPVAMDIRGCCPWMFGCQQPAPAPTCCADECCAPTCCAPACSEGCDSCGMGQLPSVPPAPPISMPNFKAPMPAPADRPAPISAVPQSQDWGNPMPQTSVQPVSYNTMYYPRNQASYSAGYQGGAWSMMSAGRTQTGGGNAFSSSR